MRWRPDVWSYHDCKFMSYDLLHRLICQKMQQFENQINNIKWDTVVGDQYNEDYFLIQVLLLTGFFSEFQGYM